jgi:hypothetical protein
MEELGQLPHPLPQPAQDLPAFLSFLILTKMRTTIAKIIALIIKVAKLSIKNVNMTIPPSLVIL